MDNGQPADGAEPNKGQEEEKNSLDWLLGKDGPETIPVPMDTNVSITR